MRGSVIVAMLLLSTSVLATDKPCSTHPMVAGKSFVVRGRLSIYNGNPTARIQQTGTGRVFGISDGLFYKKGYANLPPSIASILDFDTDIVGDFTVYPFTASKLGVMQLICIEAVKNRVVKKSGK